MILLMIVIYLFERRGYSVLHSYTGGLTHGAHSALTQ